MTDNRAYQATRLYSTPPVFGEHDERRETGDYGLMHLVITITKRRCFNLVVYFLPPSEVARLLQVCKRFSSVVEAAEEQLVMHLHALYFSHVPLLVAGGRKWTRCLHDLTNKSHKLLIIGGYDGLRVTNRVDMMVIDDIGTISWQACNPMTKNRWFYSTYYCQGEVLSVSSCGHDGQGTGERYDVLSQTAVELEHDLPIQDLWGVAIAQLDGKAFAIGGDYKDAANRKRVELDVDRVFCLDNKRHRGQAGTWIEQEARLITGRSGGAAATYQGKVWLAGGRDDYGRLLSSIEVFDPVVGSWQAAGNLTMARFCISHLFVIKDALFAAGCTSYDSEGMWVEKRDAQTGTWQLLSRLNDGNRDDCALAACGSTIYFLGGNRGSSTFKSWNSFDTRTSTWASQQEQYRDEATRQLPRIFNRAQAVCITPSEQISGLCTWTSYPDFVHHEDKD
jgi:hypothetical protein